jgi:glycosidase
MHKGERMDHWSSRSVFYHIYPLGCFGAPPKNDFSSPPSPRLKEIEKWIPHLKKLHANALYLGPVFESSGHGYDTADYYQVDRRLGDNQTLREMIALLHKNNIRVILDGVFNHVGRDFFAFRDIQKNGRNSPYCSWFSGIDFARQSTYGDGFAYDGWNGHFDLVKLNLQNPAVSDYLFKAVDFWMTDFQIDGLRIDAADCVDFTFLQQLFSRCKTRNSDFWIMGEVIHGDYARWINAGALDSVTNYECFKGLYSSHVDQNYFEIAYSLNRQFGEQGIYRHFLPYSFVDNHDVNRLTSNLTNPAHVYPVYCLLFSMPGVPSIYYGSEWGMSGRRTPKEDGALRPRIDSENPIYNPSLINLPDYIAKLIQVRLDSRALQAGSYKQVFVNHEQFAFLRETSEESILTILNSSQQTLSLEVPIPMDCSSPVKDLLTDDVFAIRENKLVIPTLLANSGRIIRIK